MLFTIVAVVITVVAGGVAYFLFGVWQAAKAYPEIHEPGNSDPFFGHLKHQADLPPEEAHLWVPKQIAKSVTRLIRLRAVGSRYLVAGEAALVNKVAQEDLINYSRSSVYEYFRPWLGKGILLSEGDEWKWRRKLLAPAFGDAQLRETFFLMIEMADKLCWVFDRKGTKEFDCEKDLKSFTLDLFGKAGMNYDFNAMDSVSKEITDAFRIVMGEQQDRLNVAWMPFWMYKLTPKGKVFLEHCRYLRKVVADIVTVRKMESQESLAKAKDPFSRLLVKGNDGSKGYEDDELVDDILTLMFAGHESTSCLIGFGLYELLRHPDMEERILQEVKQVVGEGPLEEKHLNQLEYLNMVLKEVLRFYTPIPGIGKSCTRETSLGGHRVCPGTDVDLSLLSVHHDKALWKDPEVFNPMRFAPGIKDPAEGAFCAFALGKRSCVGRGFAMMEARVFFAHVLPRIQFRLVPGQKVVPVSRINTNMIDGMLVTAARRTGPLSLPMPPTPN